jgi:hypothetical protein
MKMTDIYRWRAIHSEQRASAATCPAVKADWVELAIEWHALAHASGEQEELNREDIEFA